VKGWLLESFRTCVLHDVSFLVDGEVESFKCLLDHGTIGEGTRIKDWDDALPGKFRRNGEAFTKVDLDAEVLLGELSVLSSHQVRVCSVAGLMAGGATIEAS